MDKRKEITNQVETQAVLPLYFHPDPMISVETAKALYRAGIRAIEYTNRGENALKNFELIRKVCDQELSGMFLGVGTIKDAAMAKGFIHAGADFLVSPGLSEDVYDITYSNKILWIPGCMTITEIMKAEQYGLQWIKVFPGAVLGPTFIESIKEIFPGMLFMPTGGVGLDKESLLSWFRSGAFAVGMGSKLLPKSSLDNREFEKIGLLTRELLTLIQSIRKK
jgi:2-dehydro-3-deoxyphosphogluconate aldolase / (4S)-4-hydroxy-2-oxoglutarate aldolase